MKFAISPIRRTASPLVSAIDGALHGGERIHREYGESTAPQSIYGRIAVSID
jgi:hypothetical protein